MINALTEFMYDSEHMGLGSNDRARGVFYSSVFVRSEGKSSETAAFSRKQIIVRVTIITRSSV
jgi:hypothetical protein